MIPLIVIPLLGLIFRKRKPKPMPEQNVYQIEKTIKEIAAIFGKDITKNIEKIYRLETSNFSSGLFLKTLGAGMEVGRNAKGKPVTEFPYGWGSLRKFWEEQPIYAPEGLVTMKENKQAAIKGSGVKKTFLKFPSLFAGMFAVGLIMQKRDNDIGRYFSNDEGQKKYYRDVMANIKTTITDKIV